MNKIVRSQEAWKRFVCWLRRRLRSRQSLTIAGSVLTVVTGFVLGTTLLAPRSADARVDCHWSAMECQKGETCAWDPKMHIHWCQKDVTPEATNVAKPTTNIALSNVAYRDLATTVAKPTTNIAGAKDAPCDHYKDPRSMAECAADDIPGRTPGMCAREVRECEERCRANMAPAKDPPPTDAPTPPTDKDAACTAARQRARTACADFDDVNPRARDLEYFRRCLQEAMKEGAACTTH